VKIFIFCKSERNYFVFGLVFWWLGSRVIINIKKFFYIHNTFICFEFYRLKNKSILNSFPASKFHLFFYLYSSSYLHKCSNRTTHVSQIILMLTINYSSMILRNSFPIQTPLSKLWLRASTYLGYRVF
jgi:hypothetical protein